MNPSLLAETLKALVKIKRTVCIEGPPGGGKTTICRDVAASLGMQYIELHLPTMLVEDFGIPVINGDTLTYKLPDWYPSKGSKWDKPQGGVLCFDDRNQAASDIQKVLANICQARTLHGVSLAAGWTVVSTGNRQVDRAGANRILSHLRNRETVLTLQTTTEASLAWMAANNVRPEVIAFLPWRPALLHYDAAAKDKTLGKVAEETGLFPSPRAWVEGVSAVLGTVPADAELECFTGAVGEAAAAEFVSFLRVFRKLPSLDAIAAQPLKTAVPTDPVVLYALSGALADKIDTKNFASYMDFVGRMPAEFQVLILSLITKAKDTDKKKAGITMTPTYRQWALKNVQIWL